MRLFRCTLGVVACAALKHLVSKMNCFHLCLEEFDGIRRCCFAVTWPAVSELTQAHTVYPIPFAGAYLGNPVGDPKDGEGNAGLHQAQEHDQTLAQGMLQVDDSLSRLRELETDLFNEEGLGYIPAGNFHPVIGLYSVRIHLDYPPER